jgi:enterochelin esterase-like enzyme
MVNQTHSQTSLLVDLGIEVLMRVCSLLGILTLVTFSLVASHGVMALEIAPDGKVTFQVSAPEEAQKVVLLGQWTKDRLPLVMEKPKTWTLTLDAVPAGVWEYHFEIDGVSVIDSTNPLLKPQRKPSVSILHIPGTPLNPWDWRDVPHGTVHLHAYQSKALGRQRNMAVYTPPGYEQATDRKYPMLVLQHGSGDQHDTWIAHGKAHWILDNLIADGKAVPMLIVMIDGHPHGQLSRESAESGRVAGLAAFESELFDDAIPLVEATYRVESAPEQRALAGLSMGGAQTLGVGLTHSDRFSWLGCFSGAMPAGDRISVATATPETLNKNLKLLWIACGDKDFLLEQNKTLIATLEEKGVHHEWHLTPGDHSWPIWRGYLSDFLPLLFR